MEKEAQTIMSEDNSMRETTEPVVRDYTFYIDDPEMVRMLGETDAALHEYLVRERQLEKFQHIYKDIKTELEKVSEKLASLLRVTFSLEEADHILCELTDLEKRVYVVLDQASDLSSIGDEMIQASNYGEDIIEPACSELRTISKELSSNLRATNDHLPKAMKLHRCLEQVSEWVDDNMFVLMPQLVDMNHSPREVELALWYLENVETESLNHMSDLSNIWREYETVLNQQFKDQVEKVLQKHMSMQESIGKCSVSLKKLAAKHNWALQPVAPRGEDVIKSPLSSPAHGAQQEETCSSISRDSRLASLSEEEKLAVSRRRVMDELLVSEQAYIEDLFWVLQRCASEMDNTDTSLLIPPLKNKKEVLFGNMDEIYDFHSCAFLRELEKYIDCPELVGRCFLEWMKDLQMYEVYIHNKPCSEKLWIKYSDCTFFQECQRNLKRWLGLDSYPMMPVQRLTTYQRILKEMLMYSTDCEGAADLQEALTSISAMLKAVNDFLHMTNIRGFKGNLNELGKLLMHGSFTVWKDHERHHGKFTDLSRVQPKQRHLFLFENALVFCKRREEKGKGYIYTFERSLSSDVDIVVNFHTFEIRCNSRKKVYVVEAPSAEIKTTWVNELKKVVAAQRRAERRATRGHQTRDSVRQRVSGPHLLTTRHNTGCN